MDKNRRKRPTQADVARLAGVSQAMVSYVLTNNTTVSIPDETRLRIQEAVRALGYIPNSTARSLRTDRTYTIASIIPDITNPFYPDFERGIQDVAEQHGYDLIMYNTDGDPVKEANALRTVQQARADGIIGVFFHLNAKDLFPLLEMNIPVVRLEAGPKNTGLYPLDNIYSDNVAAAESAVSYLIGRGHVRIGMLTGSGGPAEARLLGYRQALTERGLPVDEALLCACPFTEEGGHAATQTLLAQPSPPSAIFAANDLIALGALIAAREAGIRVPEGLAIVGFDDISMGRLVIPPLTTVAIHQDLMGRRAAEMLLERLQSGDPMPGRNEEIPFNLIVRASA
jgi:LacI family transcriptional regulator